MCIDVYDTTNNNISRYYSLFLCKIFSKNWESINMSKFKISKLNKDLRRGSIFVQYKKAISYNKETKINLLEMHSLNSPNNYIIMSYPI